MDANFIFTLVIFGIFIGGVFFGIGYMFRKLYAERLIRTAEGKAREILTAFAVVILTANGYSLSTVTVSQAFMDT